MQTEERRHLQTRIEELCGSYSVWIARSRVTLISPETNLPLVCTDSLTVLTAASAARRLSSFKKRAFDRAGKHCAEGCFLRSRDSDYYDNHG